MKNKQEPYIRQWDERRYCGTCGKPLGYRNKTGYCNVCTRKTPEFRKKISKGMKNSESFHDYVDNTLRGSTIPDEVKKKISDTVKKKTSFRHMGLNRKEDTSTEAERAFAALHPEFKREVSFGTGIGGLKKWKSTRFFADFVDEENNIVYEIDGSSHNMTGRKERDNRKDAFLKSIGYTVIRIKEDGPYAILH